MATKAALAKWLAEHALTDEWLLSRNGQPPDAQPVTLEEADWIRLEHLGQTVHVLHRTQAAMNPPPWVPLESLAPPPPGAFTIAPPVLATSPAEPLRVRQLGAKAKITSSAKTGCGLLGLFFGICALAGAVGENSPDETQRDVDWVLTFLILGGAIWSLAVATTYRCTRCQQNVPKDSSICPSCRCEFE